MLNSPLVPPKDRQLFKLQNTIKRFKEYDEKRKKYINSLLEELDNSRLFQESESVADFYEKLNNKINNLSLNLKAVQRANDNLKMKLLLISNPEKLQQAEKVISHTDILNIAANNNKLKTENDHLRSSNNELVAEVVKLKAQIKELKVLISRQPLNP